MYLLGRDAANPSMRFAGLGLAAYALALAFIVVLEAPRAMEELEPSIIETAARLGWPLIILPAFFWFGSLFFLIPSEEDSQQPFEATVRLGLIPLATVFYIAAAASDLFIYVKDGDLRTGSLYPLLVVLLGLLWLAGFIRLVKVYRTSSIKRPISLIMVATLFFGLGMGLILFPVFEIPRSVVLLAVGFDLTLLGMTIAFLDAFGQGESLIPDMSRSLLFSFFITILFAGQVGLAMAFSTGATGTMFILLLATILTAVTITTFSDFFQRALDGLAFAQRPHIRSTRDASRSIIKSAPRIKETFEPSSLDEEQFNKLTRKALSQLGNLPKLSANPLTRMPIISKRLIERGASDNSLERVAELKILLVESIKLLKPRERGEFGTTDEWRFFNALYYPYVAGIKPYSRQTDREGLDPHVQEALNWFQTQVPERTLYNWQSAAAGLVAQDLRERNNNNQ